uniref:Parafibromin n=1 Tax=Polytomella parva TaxID=51329 RepID=A0A7S0UQC4_9CHLO|eukprot:CAMPEP_0175079724 /NCGR_PEP_ID=MMETSP0052_2-20121109/24997_1 /TAXON_ID=51329 ORGANISM="Polytomella parva, Strain SAG 63-3" /NCGR_SAMPLE_ID=MMETSP0052_2 /ASSEMBLY_ACC=CAM_ASM_000194 /LENGTH=434 /DNA_ID=CAMNT_0016350117 /DNA_START=41 /DNA_END=1345 /DNA_ORIENTATION=+
MNPLTVLKDFNLQNKLNQIYIQNGSIIFGDKYQFPTSSPAYSKKDDGTYYSLLSILVFLQRRLLKRHEYIVEAKNLNVEILATIDQQPILDYLDGLVKAEINLPLITNATLETTVVAVGEEDAEHRAKRARTAGDASSTENYVRERHLRDRNSMLLSPTTGFQKVLDIVAKVESKLNAGAKSSAGEIDQARPGQQTTGSTAAISKPDSRSTTPHSTGITSHLTVSNKNSNSSTSQAPGSIPGGWTLPPPNLKKPDCRIPIIIVPSGMSSLITMRNARSFFEEGKFLPASGLGMANSGGSGEIGSGGASDGRAIMVKRKSGRVKPVPYVITDQVPEATDPAWNRVVAVLVHGVKWQFTSWPHKGASSGDPTDVLRQVCGFYVHYQDEQVKPPVSEWNVRRLPLARDSRHRDASTANDFFRQLDTWLTARKSTLEF